MAEAGEVTGSSLESFARAADEAFAEIPQQSNREVAARVTKLWMTKGGFVHQTQYHVALEKVEEAD